MQSGIANCVFMVFRDREFAQSCRDIRNSTVRGARLALELKRRSKILDMTAVGFEPTQLALVELESTPLDHSGKLSLVWFCLFEPFSFEWLTSEAGSAMNVRLGDPRKTSAKFILISGFPPPPPQKKSRMKLGTATTTTFQRQV